MEIKLKSFGVSDYFDAFFVTIILSLIGFPIFFQSIRLILIEKFSFLFLVGIILGIIIFFVLFMSIKTISKNIIFYADFYEVQFLSKVIKYNYSETEWIKFINPYRGSARIVIRIKKRKYGVKSIPVNLKNKKEDLMILLNHARSKGVSTGLNEVGEQYFKFNKITGKYEARQDKRIDISKLW